MLRKTLHYLRLTSRKRRVTAAIVLGLTILAALVLTLGTLRHPDLSNVSVVKHEVSQHFLLPTNEQPALATITDSTKLTSSFFKLAHNGDKVLIYQKNQIAIIYRPSIDRIIAVGPVSIDIPPTTNSKN